jgi:2-polyprenyl-3-methyl-5-hydroxy-6-metoxy-1,4-benzoquinol methylase
MNAWDAIAEGYDRTNTPSQMWLGSEGLRRAGLRPGMRFLDVAAGSGALSIPAARLGARVLATDLSPAMLELLEARAREEELSIETRGWTATASSWTTTASTWPARSSG